MAPMVRWSAVLTLTACSASTTTTYRDRDAAPDAVLEHDTGAGDVLEHDQLVPDVLEEQDPSDAAPDVAGDVSASAHDAGDAASDAPVNPCAPATCSCQSANGVSCPADLPYLCNQGEECCNWRPPGC